MIRRLLLLAVAVLLVSPRADAAPINLLLTTDVEPTTVGPPALGFGYMFWESATNDWLGDGLPDRRLLSGSATLMPGQTQFAITLDVDSLANVYFRASGSYDTFIPSSFGHNLYAAMPPEGSVDGSLAFGFGPPWIPLANLGDGLTGDFQYFLGVARSPIGTWAIEQVPAEVTPVPEPASMLLLGGGLAAIAAKRYRRRRDS